MKTPGPGTICARAVARGRHPGAIPGRGPGRAELSDNSYEGPPIGSTFAGYRIDGVIGRGGMGVVYRATEMQPERTVALKVVAPQLAASPQFHARFLREARIAASLEHPNVVPVLNVGEEDGALFIAMRLIQGTDLAGLIRSDGALNPLRAARIVDQVADALDAAHARGLVHRDVKPSNVLLESGRRGDFAYLVDFGLTKQLGEEEKALTRSGMVVGTVDYLSPEVITGGPVDARTDIYALGVVLFVALTGQVPFGDRSSEFAAMLAHVNEAPPAPSERHLGVPVEFDAVIARAMAKDPADRFGSAGELGAAAIAAAEGRPIAAQAPPAIAQPGAAAPAPPAIDWSVTKVNEAIAPARVNDGMASPTVIEPLPPAPTDAIRRRPIVRAQAHASARASEIRTGIRPSLASATTRIPLDPKFRYSQGPLPLDSPIPLLHRGELVTELARRIDRSAGGSLLITGFRGVGKTTVVDRALRELRRLSGDKVWVTVRINLASPRTPAQLLFEVIRALYEQLEDDHQLADVGPEARKVLETAYQRTSRSLKETLSSSIERSRDFGLSAGPAAASIISPKAGFSKKLASSLSGEATYLEYSDVDAQHDFARIVRLLGRNSGQPPAKKGLARWFGAGAPAPQIAVRLIIVLDELDKLAEWEGGTEWIRTLLTQIKNVLTLEGCNFVFVAGPDLHEMVEDEISRGGSIFESVFGWRSYVPCVWESEATLLDALLADPEPRANPRLAALCRYLAYTGRGIPRLILRELGTLVRFDGDDPYLELGPEDLDVIELGAGLQTLVSDFVEARFADDVPANELDEWRLGLYYAIDWILRFQVTFTARDVVALQSEVVLNPMLALHQQEVQELLDHLAANGILEQIAGELPDVTFYGDVPPARVAAYRLSDQAASAIRRCTALRQPASADHGDLVVLRDEEAAFLGELGQTLAAGRYELIEELGRGGAGSVYRARDRHADEDVVIKLFSAAALGGDELMRARFLREGAVARELHHPRIVRTREVLHEDDGRLAIVNDLVLGQSLADRVATGGPVEPHQAVSIILGVLDALDYVHARGIARLDLTPGSIIVGPDGSPTISDLGLAKHIDRGGGDAATAVGAIVGTPAYAPPEQMLGHAVDIRGDLYATALILFELIAGRRARQGQGVSDLLASVRDAVDVSRLAVSEELRSVLHIALQPDPASRYRDPAAMIEALRLTPEGAHARLATRSG